MRDDVRTLAAGFLRSAEYYPQRVALEVGGAKLTYQALYDAAKSLSRLSSATCQMMVHN